MNKLKPVIFVGSKYPYHEQNTSQQLMLLKALRITQDPKKLRELMGVKSVADVYRTLDKLSMRKEYHKALSKAGIDFNYIVKGIKNEIDGAEKSSDRLTALAMLLKSVGLDKYEDNTIGGGSWEDALLNSVEKKKLADPTKLPEVDAGDYEVVQPVMPDAVKKKKEEEKQAASGLYD